MSKQNFNKTKLITAADKDQQKQHKLFQPNICPEPTTHHWRINELHLVPLRNIRPSFFSAFLLTYEIKVKIDR